ncbi:MAG: hypothetical protein AMXMBFR67_36100 [Nitrospira sp.]
MFSIFVTTFAETQKWKIEKKLELLQRERENLEKLSSDVLQKVLKGMIEKGGRYDIGMLSDMVLMPKPVYKVFSEWTSRGDKNVETAKETFMTMSFEAKKALLEVDEKIKRLIDA